jgi:hypothetical protein
MTEKNVGAVASGAGSIKDISSNRNHGTASNSPVYVESQIKTRNAAPFKI